MKKRLKITMPSLTPGMKSAVLCAWMKNEGDEIKKGDVIYEVETDKVVLSVESDVNGVMTKLIGEEGDILNVGDEIAEIETEE